MGGISCYFQFDSSQNKAVLDVENLNKSLKYISHRGPGAASTYFSACGRTGLGFAQLSIINLDNGQQPLSNQQDDIHVVIDGELYDSKQIQNELQAKGYQLKTSSDSEIALCLYQEYGLSFLDHLRGEFSLCIWDAKKNRFILARDRFGAKPLYYTIVKGTLLVASEIKAFLSLGWDPEWDIDSLMSNGVLFDCRTAFKGVNKLPPAHYMAATSTASIQIRPYWCQKYANKYVKDTHSIESMIQGVRERLVDAVKQRLKADMAIGIYLDDEDDNISSCCVAGIVNQIRKESNSSQHIKAFSLAIVDDTATTARLNENRAVVAKTTADLCDADLEILQITEQELLDNFEESIWHTEQPHLDLKHVGKFVLSKLVRDQGFKVVLTGQGADEHFAGHPHFLRDYLKETDATLPDGFDTLSNQDRNAQLQEIDMNTVGKNQAQNMLGNATAPAFLETNFALTPSFYSKAAIKKYGHPNRVLTVAEALNGISRNNAISKWHPLHTAMSVQCTTLFPNHVLSSLSDRSAMAHSVETRLPFLDHPLCDYVNRLPPSVKIKADKKGRITDKWLLREAAKPYVTTKVYEGSNHPTSTWTPSSLFIELLEKHLTRENVERLGWIDYDTVKAAKENYRITKSDRTYRDLLIVMSYVVMSEQFNVATARFEAVTFRKTTTTTTTTMRNRSSSEQHHRTALFEKMVMAALVMIGPVVYACYFC
ncbi:hypothetical protein PS15m_002756 [Mucor circinelloides]